MLVSWVYGRLWCLIVVASCLVGWWLDRLAVLFVFLW